MGAREEIPYRLRTHRTANMLLDLAPSKKMLYRYLAELREQNRAFVVGRTRTANGRPQNVLLNRKDKGDNIEHNLTVTRLLDAFGMPFRVGPEVDQRLLPDAEIGQLCIEVDLGTMDGNRMEAKCVRYVDAERPVVAVTTSENRVETLREHGSLLEGWLLCTTLAEALKKGQATNWKNKVYALEEVLKQYGSFHEGSTT